MKSALNKLLEKFPLEAGQIALNLRKKVKNEHKQPTDFDIRPTKENRAKTVVDDIIQELFLTRVWREFPRVRVNAEENTPIHMLLKEEKTLPIKIPVLHIDPIDGTYSYLTGRKEFATGIAHSNRSGNFTHSAIYFPALDRLCIASPRSFGIFDRAGKKRKFPGRTNTRLIFTKRIFSKSGIKELARHGFRVAPPPSAHYAIVMVALGKAAAYLYGMSNPHDSMIPYAFAKRCGIGAETLRGKKITGNLLIPSTRGRTAQYARIPSVCYFSCGTPKKNIIHAILKNKKNLDREYLARGAPYE